MVKKYIEIIKISILIAFTLTSCGEVKRVDTKMVKAHISDYKIKKADQATIVLQAETWSQALGDSLEHRMDHKLQRATSPSHVQRICTLSFDPWVDSLAKTYAVDMDLWGKNTKPEKLALPQEQELYTAYQYALENKLPLQSNLQKSGDSLFLFTRPMPELARVCLGDTAGGMSILRIKMPKAAVVKSLPFRKK